MGYNATGRGTLILRFDEKAISGMKARMRVYYDELSQKGIEAYRPDEYMMQIHQSVCETEKEALEKEQPTEWLESALSSAGFSEIYFTKLPEHQLLHVETEFDAKYREDEILKLLEALSPQTITGNFSFCGEDNGIWRLVFIGISWCEQRGEIVYKDEAGTGPLRQAPDARRCLPKYNPLCSQIRGLLYSAAICWSTQFGSRILTACWRRSLAGPCRPWAPS